MPDWVSYCDYAKPLLKIELFLSKSEPEGENELPFELQFADDPNSHLQGRLVWNKTDMQIFKQFDNFFAALVTCFNDFSRPEFVKIR